MPEVISIHGMAGCISACTPVVPSQPMRPVEVIDSARHEPSGMATNAEPPESPWHVDVPMPPMLAVLPSEETTWVMPQRLVPGPPSTPPSPNPAIATGSPPSIMSSSQP